MTSDLEIADGRIHWLRTGASRRIDPELFGEAAIWTAYYLSVCVKSLWNRASRPPGPLIWFAPVVPQPWYLVRAAAAWAGVRMARSPEEAVAAFYFDDVTLGAPPAPGHERHFNFGCHDVSKSRVAEVFELVFDYPLRLDPATWNGPAVEKGEANGVHDGCIVACPTSPRAGKVYQRLIETSDGEFTYDLRTPCVGGKPIVVWEKQRRATARFRIQNVAVRMRRPDDVFSADEIVLIGRFAEAMKLDWGGLDILRDRVSGRIYVVDVNKTDIGPVLALPWLSKIAATRALAAALLALVGPV